MRKHLEIGERVSDGKDVGTVIYRYGANEDEAGLDHLVAVAFDKYPDPVCYDTRDLKRVRR
jgi:hypothetical protein